MGSVFWAQVFVCLPRCAVMICRRNLTRLFRGFMRNIPSFSARDAFSLAHYARQTHSKSKRLLSCRMSPAYSFLRPRARTAVGVTVLPYRGSPCGEGCDNCETFRCPTSRPNRTCDQLPIHKRPKESLLRSVLRYL